MKKKPILWTVIKCFVYFIAATKLSLVNSAFLCLFYCFNFFLVSFFLSFLYSLWFLVLSLPHFLYSPLLPLLPSKPPTQRRWLLTPTLPRHPLIFPSTCSPQQKYTRMWSLPWRATPKSMCCTRSTRTWSRKWETSTRALSASVSSATRASLKTAVREKTHRHTHTACLFLLLSLTAHLSHQLNHLDL